MNPEQNTNRNHASAAHDLDAGNSVLQWLHKHEAKYIEAEDVAYLRAKYNTTVDADSYGACSTDVYSAFEHHYGRELSQPLLAALMMRFTSSVFETIEDEYPGLGAAEKLLNRYEDMNKQEEWEIAVEELSEKISNASKTMSPYHIIAPLVDILKDDFDEDLCAAFALAAYFLLGARMYTSYIIKNMKIVLSSSSEKGVRFLSRFLGSDHEALQEFFAEYCTSTPYQILAKKDESALYVKERPMTSKRKKVLFLLQKLSNGFYSEGGLEHESLEHALSLVAEQGDLFTGDDAMDSAVREALQLLDEDSKDFMHDLKSACEQLQMRITRVSV